MGNHRFLQYWRRRYLLNGKLRAGFDYFRKLTKGILLTPQTPLVLGGAVPRANLGEMKNQGWELTLDYTLRHNDFNHTFRT